MTEVVEPEEEEEDIYFCTSARTKPDTNVISCYVACNLFLLTHSYYKALSIISHGLCQRSPCEKITFEMSEGGEYLFYGILGCNTV